MSYNIEYARRKLTFRRAAKCVKRPVAADFIIYLEQDYKLPAYKCNEAFVSNGFDEYMGDENLKIVYLDELKNKIEILGENYKYLDSFENDFKTLAEDVLKEDSSICSKKNMIESLILDENVIHKLAKPSKQLLRKINNIVSSVKCKKPPPEEEIVPEVAEENDDNEEGSEKTDQEKEVDNVSGVWGLIKDYKEFKITYPGYNVFTDDPEGKFWIEREDLPWKIINKSQLKCAEWLEKYCEEN